MAKTIPGIVSSDNSSAGDTDYPEGSARNISAPNAGDGTPWVAEIVNQYDAFFQRIMSEANVSYNGDVDTVPTSQFYAALTTLFSISGYVIDATGIRRTVDDEQTVISGSDDPTEGSRVVLYGPNNASKPYDFELYGDGIAFHYDDSNDRYDWKNKSFTAVASFAFNAGPQALAGSGTPEGNVSAPPGSTYQRTDGGAGTTFYVKETGTGNTGWVAVGASGSTEWTQLHNSSPSGTSVEVTGVPAGTNEIKLFINLGSSSANTYNIKIGDSGGIEASGYSGAAGDFEDDGGASGNTCSLGGDFVLHCDASNDSRAAIVTLSRFTGNTWIAEGHLINNSGTEQIAVMAGEKTLSGTLDRVSLNASTGSLGGGTFRVAYR